MRAAVRVVGVTFALSLVVVATSAPVSSEPRTADGPIAAVKLTATSPRAEYLATMRALLVGHPGQDQSDATLIEGGRSICAQIEDGATRQTFEAQLVEFDLDRTVYRVIIRSSIKTFCPEHITQAIR